MTTIILQTNNVLKREVNQIGTFQIKVLLAIETEFASSTCGGIYE